MVGVTRYVKIKQHPLPHDIYNATSWNIDTGGVDATIVPIIKGDDAKTPGSVYSNPEHASFAEYSGSNCSPESRINSIDLRVRVSRTSYDSINTPMRFGLMLLHSAFPEDLDAKDELSTLTVKEIIEMQKESSDRQAYPLYNGTKCKEKFTGSATLNTDEPGLTTNQIIEQVDFDPDVYYDAIKYYTNSGKLRSCTTGLRWFTFVNLPSSSRVIRFRITRDVKRINPYTQLSLLMFFPQSGTKYQIPVSGETANTDHFHAEVRARYYEWNDMFHHEKA